MSYQRLDQRESQVHDEETGKLSEQEVSFTSNIDYVKNDKKFASIPRE